MGLTIAEQRAIDDLMMRRTMTGRLWAQALAEKHFTPENAWVLDEEDIEHMAAFFDAAIARADRDGYETAKRALGSGKSDADVKTTNQGAPDDFTDDAPATQTRLNALDKATEIYKRVKSPGVFGTGSPMAVSEIIILAEYIRKGSEKP